MFTCMCVCVSSTGFPLGFNNNKTHYFSRLSSYCRDCRRSIVNVSITTLGQTYVRWVSWMWGIHGIARDRFHSLSIPVACSRGGNTTAIGRSRAFHGVYRTWHRIWSRGTQRMWARPKVVIEGKTLNAVHKWYI